MQLCPLSVTFHFSAVWAFTADHTGHIHALALKVSEAEKHVLVSDISVHLRDHLWNNVPGGVTSTAWLGRKEADLKACQ